MKRIFFIDDDPMVIKSFSRTMKKYADRFEFHFFNDCREAMEELGRLTPHICIVDKRLPFMGGVEFLDYVRNFDSSIYRILISGDTPPAEKSPDYDAYLEKPVSSVELIGRIGELLDSP